MQCGATADLEKRSLPFLFETAQTAARERVQRKDRQDLSAERTVTAYTVLPCSVCKTQTVHGKDAGKEPVCLVCEHKKQTDADLKNHVAKH